MATRDGYHYGHELVTRHGWRWDETPVPEDWCGDGRVVDPLTGKTMSPHEGRAVQAERNPHETTRPDERS